MAKALATVEHPMIHVVEALPEYAGPIAGNSHAPDEEIAKWSGRSHYVLVTTDEDFRGRWVRSGLLAAHGVEVIVFDREVKGLQTQHARITAHLPYWQLDLSQNPFAHRVWVQRNRMHPDLFIGKKRRPRSRAPMPVPTKS